MSKIYKYASIDNGLLILKNENVVVSNPTTFNDPFDSELLVKNNDLQIGIETYINFLLENDILDCCKKVINNKKDIQSIICNRFVKKINKRRSKAIIKGSYFPLINFQYIQFLVKIFGFTIPKDYKNDAIKSFGNINNIINSEGPIKIKDLITKLPSNLRISCFSKRPDISKMWSHYANKHNGICLEYENIKDTYNIEYVTKEKYVKFFNFIKKYLAVLCDTNNQYDYNDFISLFPILNKSIDWKEEQEIRMIISYDNELISKATSNGKDIELYPIGKPKKVIIGVNVKKEKQIEIINYCKKHDIPVNICKKRNYKIIIEKF